MNWPLVSVGIPTVKRPQLLARALESVARQDYPNLEVIVADNASPGGETGEVVESFRGRIANLKYHRHPSDIGPLANFRFLLEKAQGEYFMWLADDDQISTNYVSALAAYLVTDQSAACAAGHWVLMQNEVDGVRMPSSEFLSRKPLARAVRFIWRTDDAFFYALHRADILRRARFEGYWWPNTSQPLNLSYVLLLDVVLRGRVVAVSEGSPAFFNDNYTAKTWARRSRGISWLFAFTLRRINVHVLYWRKCAVVLSPASLFVVVPVSIASLFREAASIIARAVVRRTARQR
jgi:glycosyltransferase involved in cell wall biosynthesis